MQFGFDVKRVQNRLLEMAKKIAFILEKNEIPYQIAFGTLLGAVRHGGFIPWDDDFDFFLFEDTYDKAMSVLKAELPQDMFLEYKETEPNYFHAWAHVKDINSRCKCEHYPQDELYSHHGVSVDLYKLTKIQTADFGEFRYRNSIEYINRRKELNFITNEDFESRKKIYDERSKKEKLDYDCKYVFAYPFDIGHQLIEDVLPLRRYKFENFEFWGPNNAEHILKMRYGDFMSLPPENQRIPHYSSVDFNN